MAIQADAGLIQAYEFLRVGNPARAKTLIEDALAQDLENGEIIFALRCVNFWLGRLPEESSLPVAAAYETGELLVHAWKQFSAFIAAKSAVPYERAMSAVRVGVFSRARDCFETALASHHPANKGDLHRMEGLCLKKLGEYEVALAYLGEANAETPNEALILAEMADCYALCGDDRRSKVLFREAFFVDAAKVDMAFIESELLRRLIEQVAQKGLRARCCWNGCRCTAYSMVYST